MLNHIHPEVNKCADLLAKEAFDLGVNFQCLTVNSAMYCIVIACSYSSQYIISFNKNTNIEL